jgi:hypothetical protein
MANEDHLKLLKQGVDAWNAWREGGSAAQACRISVQQGVERNGP